MNFNIFQRRSIKARVTLFTLTVFLIGIWSLSIYASRMLRTDMQRILGEHLFSTVSFVAAALNDELESRIKALEKVAETITPAILGNQGILQTSLEHNPTLPILFSGGTFITGLDGTTIADISPSTRRIGINYIDRDYLTTALKGESNISKPVISRALLSPVFVVSVPIKDSNGKVIGVLAGVVDLGKRTFLDNITEHRYGNTGGYLLIAPQHKLFVTATDKSRVMKPLPAPGMNRMHDRYMNGFDGYGLAKSSRGIEELTAAKHIPVAGWFVVAVLPAAEAFASIRAMQQNMLFATIVLTLLVGGLTWWVSLSMLRRNLSPMLDAAKLLERYSGTGQLPQPIPITSQNEIGQLIGAFNRLLETVGQREESLRELNDKIQEQYEYLQVKDESLRKNNDQLLATEEMLREQIFEYETTHDHLQATEEMLRVQLNAVEESSQKFKAVFDNSPITVALTTLPDGKFHEMNHAFIEMFGYSPEEAIGKTTLELGVWLHEADRNRYLQILRENGFVSNFEAQMRRKGGEEFTVYFSGTLLEIAGKSYALSAVMDISELKRLQTQIIQSQKMEVVGQLAGGIAHDFNNMLAGIMSAADLLKFRMSGEDRNMKLVETILNAATRSAELTRELLVFSRKGRTNKNVPVVINDIITAVIDLLERTIDKRIHLIARLDAENSTVNGDSTLLQNALLNLGVNARDAMPEGGTLTYSTLIVTLDDAFCKYNHDSIAPGRYLQISVSDTGVGIPKEIIDRIFEPFFTTKETGKGTGLGLAAVYGTVKDHHGSINVCSEPGNGTIFNLFIPLSSAECKAALPIEGIFHGSGGILLVDDEEMIRSMAKELLTELGYTVYMAEDGYKAQEIYALHKEEITLVVLDMIMPKMNGKETYLKLREINPDVRVLLCSGFHREGTTQELIEFGAKGFIKKPYSMIELSQAVSEAVGL